MNRKKISNILRFLFLICAGVYIVHANLTQPRILVLHSYYTNFSWDTDMDIGIQRVIGDRPYNIRYHYMDTKRNPSEIFKEKAGIRARAVIKDWNPNIIIALDDNAQQYVSKYFINDPNINILYAGVNGDLSKYGFDKANNVSGITEDLPWAAANSYLKKIFPAGSRLLHISDDSPSSKAIHDEIVKVDWTPFKFLDSIQVHNFAQWKQAVKNSEGKADVLLITHYHTIRDPQNKDKVIESASIIKWTEANTSLLTMGFWGFFVADGGMLSIGLSPFEQGEEPAKMAVQIIENSVSINEIKPIKARMYVIHVRKSAFEKRLGKKVPVDIEAFARAIDGYYD